MLYGGLDSTCRNFLFRIAFVVVSPWQLEPVAQLSVQVADELSVGNCAAIAHFVTATKDSPDWQAHVFQVTARTLCVCVCVKGG